MKEKIDEFILIDLLKKKDKRAIQNAYEYYSPILLAICMRYFKQRDLALDVMHEGFVKALDSIDSFNNEGSFEGWLKRIVVNHSLDTLRKEQKHQFQELDEVDAVGEELEVSKTVDRRDINENIIDVSFVRDAEFTSREILDEIQKLPEIYSLVFTLFVLEEFTHAQIATQLGIDQKASRTRLRRARQMIKEALYKRSITILGK